MENFDLLVIGSGSGLNVANCVANRGRSVAVIEKGSVGGTCLNRGCIPSKELLYHADVYQTVERASEFNISASVHEVDFADIVRGVNEDVSADANSIRNGLQSSPQHELFEGDARFVDDKTIEIVDGTDDGVRLGAESILIATGSRPSIPDIAGINNIDYLTSTDALQLQTPPDHLIIVGGGFVAAEFGHFFGTFGSDVTIIGRQPTLLPQVDEDIAEAFTNRFSNRCTVHTGYVATAVIEQNGMITVDARRSEYGDEPEIFSGDTVTVTGDELLVAAGRKPNSDTLNLDATSVETDESGFIKTDEYLRTDADGVWALGDIVGKYMFKHTANYEAKTVANNILDTDRRTVDYSAMPFAVFTSPEVAGVGACEEELRLQDREYATSTSEYKESARGQAMNATGFIKVLVDLEGRILGCHIIGPEASTLIQEVVVAMQSCSGTVHDIRGTVHIHPALPEVVKHAFSGQFRPGDTIRQRQRD